jgi:hypothetical protein
MTGKSRSFNRPRFWPEFSNLGKPGSRLLSATLIAQVLRFARACGLLLEKHKVLPKTPNGARVASGAVVVTS